LARALGRSCGRNPYPEHSREASLWIHGWWLVQEAAAAPPADEFEYEPPSLPAHFQFEDPSSRDSLEQREEEPVVYSSSRTVGTLRALLNGLLLAAAWFLLFYSILRLFLL